MFDINEISKIFPLKSRALQFVGTLSYLLILIWLFFSAYALLRLNTDCFSRMGSVGVTAAFLIFLSRRIRSGHEYDQIQFNISTLISQSFATTSKGDEEMQKTIAALNEQLNKKNEMSLSLGRESLWEALLITISTLQWGFGDLIASFFITLGSSL